MYKRYQIDTIPITHEVTSSLPNNEEDESLSSSEKSDSEEEQVKPKLKKRSIESPIDLPVLKDWRSYSRAREKLMKEIEFQYLPCRKNEQDKLSKEIEHSFSARIGKVIYISGVPGTGKTATVMTVMRNLEEQKETNPPFLFFIINALSLSQPKKAYTELYRQLAQVKAPHELARNKLIKFFKKTQPSLPNRFVILLLDEVDFLLTKKQEILYDFFEWANYSNSKLIIMAISNTTDLPERVFTNKIISRLGLTRISFSPYTIDDLRLILKGRLGPYFELFVDTALKYISNKVATTSSDVRQALQIARKALTLVEEENKKSNPPPDIRHPCMDYQILNVSLAHVSGAVTSMSKDPKALILPSLSEHERLFIVATMIEQEHSKDKIILKNVLSRHETLATSKMSLHPLNGTEFEIICSNLNNLGYIQLEKPTTNGSHKGLYRSVVLGMDRSDLLFILRDDPVAVLVLGGRFYSG